MSGYIGTQPVPQATQTRDAFTCTAGQTSFATSGYTPSFLDVYLNGIKLAAADYTASNGSDVVLASGAALNDILEVVAYTTFDTANVTGADDFTVTGSFTSKGIDDNATSTAMTLDASGNLLVGKTATGAGVVGTEIFSAGLMRLTRDAGSALLLDRKASDGDIMEFRKDGSTVGSIGVYNTGNTAALCIGYADTGLSFQGHTNNSITPIRTDTGANYNGVLNLGANGSSFKDLYLSGGVYLGGTSSANKLDDYEEGAFTPNFGGTTGNPTVTFTTNEGYYRKVGGLVFVQGRMTLSSASGGSGSLEIDGLPFTPVADAVLSVTRLQGLSINVSASGPIGILVGPDFVYYTSNTTGNHTVLTTSALTNSTSINFSGCYAI
jgi:hypothetical protein